jgi:hypothetical protein
MRLRRESSSNEIYPSEQQPEKDNGSRTIRDDRTTTSLSLPKIESIVGLMNEERSLIKENLNSPLQSNSKNTLSVKTLSHQYIHNSEGW